MKAGIAASVMAFELLAGCREAWNGEVVLALVGDEETGGVWGTQYLLANIEEAVGDAMINGDAGSPLVARIGEKGNLWIKVCATGVPNHGAHVHLGHIYLQHTRPSNNRPHNNKGPCVRVVGQPNPFGYT